jgi:hypothetical protein
VDVGTWRRLRLLADNRAADGTRDVIEVETLQSPEWIEANRAQLGSFTPLPLELEEMGLPRGTVARVVANEPCPALEQGPGNTVLTTVNHLNNDVCKLVVADADGRAQTIFPTAHHKFYSASRNAWVSTQNLKPGEQLNGIAGAVVVRSVARIPGIRRVYNMTVEAEHTYRVSGLGVLVHNNGCASDPPPINGSTPANRTGNLAHNDALNGGQGAEMPTKTQAQYPNTEFYFTPRFVKGPDVTVTGGQHPSTYPGSTWPAGNPYGDFKPATPGGTKTFKSDVKTGKLPPNTTLLPYDPVTRDPVGGPSLP